MTGPGTTTATELADELLDAVNEQDLLVATLCGFRDRDDRLRACTEAGEAAMAARLADIRARARELDPAGLSTGDRLTCAVIHAVGGVVADRLAARSVEYTISPLFVAPAAQLLFGLPMTGTVEPTHADGYLARLRAIPRLPAHVATRHRAGVAAGRLPVRRLVDAAVAHLDRYLANAEDNALRRPRPPADGTAFTAERDRLVDGEVREAFVHYRAVLADETAPHGRPDDRAGLCRPPDGEATYARLVRARTTVTCSAGELHRTGLELIERLAEEYRTVGERVFGPIDLPDLFERLRTDPALRWRDGAEILATTRTSIARAEQAAPRWFGRLPADRCTVAAVPADEAPGAPAGNYLPAALDGSRPATYFANPHRPRKGYRHSAEAMAYHEAVPGHHVQVALARELPGFPLLRRVAKIDAFAEGWGLYAERLADEMGLYTDDVARLGMPAGDSARAARPVVDTGIHRVERSPAVRSGRRCPPGRPRPVRCVAARGGAADPVRRAALVRAASGAGWAFVTFANAYPVRAVNPVVIAWGRPKPLWQEAGEGTKKPASARNTTTRAASSFDRSAACDATTAHGKNAAVRAGGNPRGHRCEWPFGVLSAGVRPLTADRAR